MLILDTICNNQPMTYKFVALPIQLSTHDEEPMNFKPVDVALSKSATQIIFESLRHSIILGEMEDGASLRQEEIAKAFNNAIAEKRIMYAFILGLIPYYL